MIALPVTERSVICARAQGTPLEYLGHLALKMAYVEETRGNVTIFLKGESVAIVFPLGPC